MRQPGYKTSEFWFTLVSFIISGLFLLGVITEVETKDELISIVTHAIESIILIGGQVIILHKYLKKRNAEKIEYEQTKRKELDIANKDLETYNGMDKLVKKIDLNRSSIGELIQLPHIGPSIAQNIIEYRSSKSFENIEDIKLVAGVGNKVYEDIKQFIVV